MEAAMRNDRPEPLASVRLVPPATLQLNFADGFAASLPIGLLEMPIDRIRWETATVSRSGYTMTVLGIRGDEVPIDAGVLRFLVDKEYGAQIQAARQAVQLSREELQRMVRDNPPPREWYAQPSRELVRESWK
jgi:hypothetical protein